MTEQAENINWATRVKTRTLSFYSIHRHVPYVSGLILVAGIAFLGGMQYQRQHTSKSSNPQVFAAHTEPQNSRGRIIGGTVQAISATSITVQDVHSNASSTYTISANTVITNKSKNIHPNDIKVGDTVAVRTDGSHKDDAARIILSSTKL